MNIHFVPDSIYSKTFINYLREKFPQQEHAFYVISRNQLTCLNDIADLNVLSDRSNVQLLGKIWRITRNKENKKVFVHFLSDIHLFPVLFSRWQQRIYWMVWGADFYSFVNYPLYDNKTLQVVRYNERKKFKQRFLSCVRRIALLRVDYIAINAIEFELIKKHFLVRAERVNFKYPNPIGNDTVNEYEHGKKMERVILLGNSGDPSNNHIEMLEQLSTVKEPFRVIVPLSYGPDKQYIQVVLNKGKELLGDKFNPLTVFMESKKYERLLYDVDVAIMNHYRQQAAGTLRVLLSQGKKVYVNDISPLYKYYTEEGAFLNTVQEGITGESLFIQYSDSIKKKNKEAMQRIYSQETIEGYIRDIF